MPFAVEISHLDAVLRRVGPIKTLIDPVDGQSFGFDWGVGAAQHDAPVPIKSLSYSLLHRVSDYDCFSDRQTNRQTDIYTDQIAFFECW